MRYRVSLGLAWVVVSACTSAGTREGVTGGGGDAGAMDGGGQPGPSAKLVSRRDAEPAGANCPGGGVAIRTGLDRNGNGILDDDEVGDTEYVCDGGPAVLVRTDRLAPGSECADGGLAVHTGIDGNQDGTLEDPEIDQTSVICGLMDVWPGDLTAIELQEPTFAAMLPGLRAVEGSLEIPDDAPMALPLLEFVGGDLEITANHEVSLSRLSTIGGSLVLKGQLPALHLDDLTSIMGGIEVQTQGALDLTAPDLTRIGGDLHAESSMLASIALPALSQLGGSLELGSLCDGDSFCSDNCPLPALSRVSIPRLSTVGGCVAVDRAPALGALELGAFAINDTVWIDGVPALTTLSLPALQRVGNTAASPAFRVGGTGLEVLDLPAVASLRGDVTIEGNPQLRAVQLPALTGDSVFPSGLALNFLGNPVLSTISAPQLTVLGSLWIQGAGSVAPDFGKLEVVAGNVTISQCSLGDLSGLGSVKAIFGSLLLSGVDQLADLRGLAALSSLSSLELESNPALTSLDGLEQITLLSLAQISANDALTSIAGLHNVTHMGALHWFGNRAVTDLALPGLQVIDQDLWLSSRFLTTLSGLRGLIWLGGAFIVQPTMNPAIPTAEIDELRARLGK
jgi:hypothetical protein